MLCGSFRVVGPCFRSSDERRTNVSTFYGLEMEAITGETVSFSEYRDQVLLIVNLASQ